MVRPVCRSLTGSACRTDDFVSMCRPTPLLTRVTFGWPRHRFAALLLFSNGLAKRRSGRLEHCAVRHDARRHERSAPATPSPLQLSRHSFSDESLFLARFPRHVRRQGKCSIRQDRVDSQIGVRAECQRAVDQLTCRGGQRLQYGHRSQMSGANKIGSHLALVRIMKSFLRKTSPYGIWTFSTLESAGCIGGLPSGHGRFVAESRCC
jgi:hypothetical protein